MDEEKYLKTKEKIKGHRMVAPILIIAGTVLLTLSVVFLIICGSAVASVEFMFLTVFLTALSVAFIILGAWAKSSARILEIALEAYDKERGRRKAQQPIQSAGAEPTAELQYCPSCGKKLQSDWKVCGYCGRGLK